MAYQVTITSMTKSEDDEGGVTWEITGTTDHGPFALSTYEDDVDYEICPEIIGNEDENGEWVDDEPIMNAIGEYAEAHQLSWPN